jgi:hypothetical protein
MTGYDHCHGDGAQPGEFLHTMFHLSGPASIERCCASQSSIGEKIFK